MNLSTKQVDDVVRSVLDVMLRLDVNDLKRSPELNPQPLMVRAQVALNGAWKGEVMLFVAPELAREMAGVMTQSDPQTMGREESFDAVGELANMIAGNLKPLLPGARSLSMPKVSDQGVAPMPANFPVELSYRLDGMRMSVSVAGGPHANN